MSYDNDERWPPLATRLVLAVMRSASTDKIRPIDWWTRARTALEAAAATAETYSHMVSEMARHLQIDSYSAASSRSISEIGTPFRVTPGDFAPFARVAERDAPYIVAMAQMQRAEEREERTA